MRKFKIILLSLATASFASVYDGKTETPATEQSEAPVAVETPVQETPPVQADSVSSAPAQAEVAAPVASEVATPATIAPAEKASSPEKPPVVQTLKVVPKTAVKTYSPAEIEHARNSFFFGATLGVRYMKLAYQEYEEYFDESSNMYIVGDKGNSTRRRFKGFGPDIGLKFGGVIASRMALYCNLELTSLDGNYKATRTVDGKTKARADFETDAVRFAIGGGSTVFLNLDTNSALYGVFASLTASIVVEEAGLTSSYYDHDELEISESGLAFGLELGKLWRLNESWNAGLVAKGTLDGTIRDGDSGNNSDCYTVGASLIVVRK